MLVGLDLRMNSTEACIKAMLTPASLHQRGQFTLEAAEEWAIYGGPRESQKAEGRASVDSREACEASIYIFPQSHF